MVTELKDVDISNDPTLVELAEEVRRSGESRALTRNGERLAVLVPVDSGEKRRRKPERKVRDVAAFLSTAGGWAHEDTEKMKADNYESRRISTRPAPDL